MKIFIFLSQFLSTILLLVCIPLFSVLAYFNLKIPDKLFLTPGETLAAALQLDSPFDLTISSNRSQGCQIKAFGKVPVKSVLVQNVDEEVVIPCGFPVGVANIENVGNQTLAAAGMMTFYDPNSMNFAGFGHMAAVSDSEKMLLYSAEIFSSSKSTKKSLGKLSAALYNEVGVVTTNSDSGIYGVLQSTKSRQNQMEPVTICPINQIEYGRANLVTTIAGDEPKYYDIIISEPKNISESCKNADFMIEVTDASLLEQTGGILQGMSGSPIIKNGKIIGALNQAFPENAKVGYGIFAEKMANSSAAFSNVSTNIH